MQRAIYKGPAMKKLFAVMLLFVCCFGYWKYYSTSIDTKLKKISDDEKKCLEMFFYSSFHDGLGYTLFGDKPITIVGYINPKEKIKDVYDFLDSTIGAYNEFNIRIRKGWEIFEKCKFLPSEKFSIVNEKSRANNFHCILFINNDSVLKTIKLHLKDFKNVLGQHVTPQNLLQKIIKSDDVFGDVLKNHQGLIGTLLGYGRHNAWLFHRREQLEQHFYKFRFTLTKPIKEIAADELEALNQKLQSFDDRDYTDITFLPIILPCFCADRNAEETRLLKQKYEKQYRKINNRYRKGDFLKITLQKLTE